MDHSRRRFLTLAVVTAAPLTISGCATQYVWEDVKDRHYVETPRAFMISEDKAKLVVFSDDYHYIFELSETLETSLDAELHEYVFAQFDHFTVDAMRNVEGTYSVQIKKGAPLEIRKRAIEKGFSLDPEALALTRKGSLSGKRYHANNVKPAKSTISPNRDYRINVTENPSLARTAGTVMITPVTVAVDGALAIGTVALTIPVMMIGVPVLIYALW